RTIFVAIATDGGNGTFTVADTAGNTYTKDADVTNGSGTSGIRTLLFSARVTTALNGTITITGATNANMAASFFSFNGLVSPSAGDKFHTLTGTGTSLDSGTTATTLQPDEVLIGAMGIDAKANGQSGFGTFTPGTGFTTLAQSGANGNQATNQVTIQ